MQIYHEFQLAHILWYKIGGRAKYLLEVTNTEDIFHAIDFIEKHAIKKTFVIGQGANLLFTDDDFDGVVIRMMQPETSSITEKEEIVKAFAGETLDNVIQYGFYHHVRGLEWAGGLPGTVGAGIRGNVGAYGGEIKDSIVSADIIDITKPEAGVQTFSNEQLHFAYRHSIAKEDKNIVIVNAHFQLQKADSDAIGTAKAVYASKIADRKAKHPLEYPNCGSVFKNIKKKEEVEKVLSVFPDLQEFVNTKWHGKVAVATLIERLGMKGYRIGNAQISEKHALFIVNLGGATAKDVLKIIHDVQAKFQETFGFQLEPEVEIVQ